MNLAKITTALELDDSGIWQSRMPGEVAYPEEGNAWCREVEDGSYWFRHRNDCILAAMRTLPPAGTVFDVGGGNGFVAQAIQAAGFDVVLIEPGAVGARNAKARGLNQVIRSTLEGAGFKPRSLPAIGLFDVVEHIADDLAFLNTARNLLTEGGRLYVTVPAYDFLWSADDEFSGHVRRYTLSQFRNRLREAGFVTEFATYIFAFLPLPILAFRTLPSRLGIRRVIPDRGKREHDLPRGPLGRLLEGFLRIELRLLKKGGRLPFGASCLMVAHAGARREKTLATREVS